MNPWRWTFVILASAAFTPTIVSCAGDASGDRPGSVPGFGYVTSFCDEGFRIWIGDHEQQGYAMTSQHDPNCPQEAPE